MGPLIKSSWSPAIGTGTARSWRSKWPSRSSRKDLLLGLCRRRLNGVEFAVADGHAGRRMAIREVLPEAPSSFCITLGAAYPRDRSDIFLKYNQTVAKTPFLPVVEGIV
jgi:hypothetical protein